MSKNINVLSSFGHVKTSNQIILLLSIILIGVISGGYLVVEQLKTLRADAYAINNLGVIRGSIQLISKRELNHFVSNTQIEKVDNIFNDIRHGYFAQTSNQDYLIQYEIPPLIDSLEKTWIKLKRLYVLERTQGNRDKQIMDTSEACWQLADDLVYRVQKISESKLMNYRNWIIQILSAISVFIILIITIVYRVINKVLERDAISDPLTQLFNRNFFNRILAEQIALYGRYTTPFTLTIVDIDHFKRINDDFGHPKGDQVLKEVAHLFKENSRDVDYLFRLGGEEFGIISPHSDLEATTKLAEKYRRLIAETDFEIGRQMTVSIGIAEYNGDSSSDELYSYADKALYSAKQSGRDKVISYSSQ